MLTMTQSFRARDLRKNLVEHPHPLPDLNGVAFGSLCSPHILIIDFENEQWGVPRIESFGNMSIPPHTSCLHYGTTCFEGMKAYSDIDDIENAAQNNNMRKRQIRLFRPDMNIRRLQNSAERLCFPPFDAQEMLKLIEEFVRVEKEWIPLKRGYSLYLRPSLIGMSPSLSLDICDKVRFFLIASPVGPFFTPPTSTALNAAYDPTLEIRPVSLYVQDRYVRAWHGGTGEFKLGANYASAFYVQREAKKKVTVKCCG